MESSGGAERDREKQYNITSNERAVGQLFALQKSLASFSFGVAVVPVEFIAVIIIVVGVVILCRVRLQHGFWAAAARLIYLLALDWSCVSLALAPTRVCATNRTRARAKAKEDTTATTTVLGKRKSYD